jgi:hypothetical protein
MLSADVNAASFLEHLCSWSLQYNYPGTLFITCLQFTSICDAHSPPVSSKTVGGVETAWRYQLELGFVYLWIVIDCASQDMAGL